MAKDKRSFILYSDLLATVSKLTDQKAGKLFKTILEYVNDQNPELDDLLLQVAFEPIKQQLKRDLKDWEHKKEKRSEAGRVGGLKSGEARSKTKQNEAKRSTMKQNEANEAVTVNGTVTDTVNVNVTERENGGFWEDEANKKFSLSHCMEVSLKDDGWVSRNKTNKAELQTFNEYLEKIADTEKTLNDYKKHFANKKLKNPELFKNAKPAITKEAIDAIKKAT